MNFKICSNKDCEIKEIQPINNFGLNRRTKDGYNYHCKKCHNRECAKRTKKYVENNPKAVKESYKKSNLKRRDYKADHYQKNKDKARAQNLTQYWPGCSPEQAQYNYNTLLFKQHNCCAICGKHESQFQRRLAVEHCHETGRVRGLACYYCNNRLLNSVSFKYSASLIKYLLQAYPEITNQIKDYLK